MASAPPFAVDFEVDPVYEHIRAPKFYDFSPVKEEDACSGDSWFDTNSDHDEEEEINWMPATAKLKTRTNRTKNAPQMSLAKGSPSPSPRPGLPPVGSTLKSTPTRQPSGSKEGSAKKSLKFSGSPLQLNQTTKIDQIRGHESSSLVLSPRPNGSQAMPAGSGGMAGKSKDSAATQKQQEGKNGPPTRVRSTGSENAGPLFTGLTSGSRGFSSGDSGKGPAGTSSHGSRSKSLSKSKSFDVAGKQGSSPMKPSSTSSPASAHRSTTSVASASKGSKPSKPASDKMTSSASSPLKRRALSATPLHEKGGENLRYKAAADKLDEGKTPLSERNCSEIERRQVSVAEKSGCQETMQILSELVEVVMTRKPSMESNGGKPAVEGNQNEAGASGEDTVEIRNKETDLRARQHHATDTIAEAEARGECEADSGPAATRDVLGERESDGRSEAAEGTQEGSSRLQALMASSMKAEALTESVGGNTAETSATAMLDGRLQDTLCEPPPAMAKHEPDDSHEKIHTKTVPYGVEDQSGQPGDKRLVENESPEHRRSPAKAPSCTHEIELVGKPSAASLGHLHSMAGKTDLKEVSSPPSNVAAVASPQPARKSVLKPATFIITTPGRGQAAGYSEKLLVVSPAKSLVGSPGASPAKQAVASPGRQVTASPAKRTCAFLSTAKLQAAFTAKILTVSSAISFVASPTKASHASPTKPFVAFLSRSLSASSAKPSPACPTRSGAPSPAKLLCVSPAKLPAASPAEPRGALASPAGEEKLISGGKSAVRAPGGLTRTPIKTAVNSPFGSSLNQQSRAKTEGGEITNSRKGMISRLAGEGAGTTGEKISMKKDSSPVVKSKVSPSQSLSRESSRGPVVASDKVSVLENGPCSSFKEGTTRFLSQRVDAELVPRGSPASPQPRVPAVVAGVDKSASAREVPLTRVGKSLANAGMVDSQGAIIGLVSVEVSPGDAQVSSSCKANVEGRGCHGEAKSDGQKAAEQELNNPFSQDYQAVSHVDSSSQPKRRKSRSRKSIGGGSAMRVAISGATKRRLPEESADNGSTQTVSSTQQRSNTVRRTGGTRLAPKTNMGNGVSQGSLMETSRKADKASARADGKGVQENRAVEMASATAAAIAAKGEAGGQGKERLGTKDVKTSRASGASKVVDRRRNDPAKEGNGGIKDAERNQKKLGRGGPAGLPAKAGKALERVAGCMQDVSCQGTAMEAGAGRHAQAAVLSETKNEAAGSDAIQTRQGKRAKGEPDKTGGLELVVKVGSAKLGAKGLIGKGPTSKTLLSQTRRGRRKSLVKGSKGGQEGKVEEMKVRADEKEVVAQAPKDEVEQRMEVRNGECEGAVLLSEGYGQMKLGEGEQKIQAAKLEVTEARTGPASESDGGEVNKVMGSEVSCPAERQADESKQADRAQESKANDCGMHGKDAQVNVLEGTGTGDGVAKGGSTPCTMEGQTKKRWDWEGTVEKLKRKFELAEEDESGQVSSAETPEGLPELGQGRVPAVVRKLEKILFKVGKEPPSESELRQRVWCFGGSDEEAPAGHDTGSQEHEDGNTGPHSNASGGEAACNVALRAAGFTRTVLPSEDFQHLEETSTEDSLLQNNEPPSSSNYFSLRSNAEPDEIPVPFTTADEERKPTLDDVLDCILNRNLDQTVETASPEQALSSPQNMAIAVGEGKMKEAWFGASRPNDGEEAEMGIRKRLSLHRVQETRRAQKRPARRSRDSSLGVRATGLAKEAKRGTARGVDRVALSNCVKRVKQMWSNIKVSEPEEALTKNEAAAKEEVESATSSPAPKLTKPQPFNLATEERGAAKRSMFLGQLEDQMAKEAAARIPVAHPLPCTVDSPHRLVKPAVKEVTRPEPFDLDSVKRHQEAQKKAAEKAVEEQRSRKAVHFRARPITSFHPPVLPPKAHIPVTKPEEMVLSTDVRATERSAFDAQVLEKRRRAEGAKREWERRQQHEAEEAVRQLRLQMVPRARPVPIFDKPFHPRRSTKHLTVPKSPHFHVPAQERLRCISQSPEKAARAQREN